MRRGGSANDRCRAFAGGAGLPPVGFGLHAMFSLHAFERGAASVTGGGRRARRTGKASQVAFANAATADAGDRVFSRRGHVSKYLIAQNVYTGILRLP